MQQNSNTTWVTLLKVSRAALINVNNFYDLTQGICSNPDSLGLWVYVCHLQQSLVEPADSNKNADKTR